MVYGKHGNNFVKTMLKLGKEKPLLRVVDDQFGAPTYTVDLCRFLEQLIVSDQYGIYHASNTGSCSWYEFAKAIFAEAGYNTQVEPCTTEELPRPAPRPKYSVIDHMSLRANRFTELQPWREALRGFLAEFRNEG
jgi:dTDP-4-dehydrorhamnose reductase